MTVKILDRYLSTELIWPFLTGLAGFVLIEIGTILFNDVIDLMLQARTPVSIVATALFYKLPLFIVLALPIATLFGVSLGVNRMAREGEINAMRMAGISLRRMLLPLLCVGAAISIIDFIIEEKIVPPANAKSDETIQRMWIDSQLPQIQADTFFHFGNYWFYLGTVSSDGSGRYSFQNAMLYELQGVNPPILTVAERGVIEGTRWLFHNVRTIQLIGNQERILHQAVMERNIDQEIEQFLVSQRKPETMSTAELSKMIEQFSKSNTEVPFLVMHYHLKYSIPFGCIVVVLVSMPLAVHFSRSGSFVGVLLSIVLFFFYYNTYFLFRLLGSSETLPPVIAAWGHNIIFGLIGIVMLWREE